MRIYWGHVDFMSVNMQLKKIIHLLLKKFNLKIERYDSNSSYESQLVRAVREINSLYNEFVFKKNYKNYTDIQISLLKNLIGTGFGEGLYLLDALEKSLLVEGDACEFGVAQGATSALIANELKNTYKNLWLFDSFEGLPQPTKKDRLINDIFHLGSMEAYKGTMACPVDLVKSRLSDIHFPQEKTKIVSGFIEETIKNPDLPKKVCFAYVDFDFYEPISVALYYLDGVLQPGGFIMVDDYNFFSEGAKIAVDEFYNKNKEQYEIQFPILSAGFFCLLRKK
jgi:O-methyltransferase